MRIRVIQLAMNENRSKGGNELTMVVSAVKFRSKGRIEVIKTASAEGAACSASSPRFPRDWAGRINS